MNPNPRPKILIVEDEAVIAMEIEMRLVRMGYEVVGNAPTGEKALVIAEATRPDLALMDINIVGAMDGVETAKHLRRHFDMPVVFLTAYSDDATIQRATIIGPLGYLTKPFSDRDVRAAIEVALYKHATDQELERQREQLEQTVAQLRAAQEEVKTLKALLPVCSSCKQIRDDEGYWSAVDAYVLKHGLATITHSICPDCIRKLYPEIAEDVIARVHEHPPDQCAGH